MTARTRRPDSAPTVDETEVAAALARVDEMHAEKSEQDLSDAVVEIDTTEEKAETPEDGVETNPDDPFSFLDAAAPAEYTRGPSRIDYEAVTSPRVKADLQASFDKYEYKTDGDGNPMENVAGKSFWMTQKFPTAQMAKAYQAQGKKYAQFKEWTFRSSFLDDKTLRFCAKPKEQRAPGSAGA